MKLSPELVAGELVRSLSEDRFEIPIGRIKALGIVSRLAPGLADAILARELVVTPTGPSPA